MTREELLNNNEYWLVNIQTDVFNMLNGYMNTKGLTQTKLAEQLGVSKGYVSQVLNGDFDYKTSKLVELALACNKVPVVYFVDKDKFIKNDAENKYYELIPMNRSKPITYEILSNPQPVAKRKEVKFYEHQKDKYNFANEPEVGEGYELNQTKNFIEYVS